MTFLAFVAWGLYGERERELLVPALSSARGFARFLIFFPLSPNKPPAMRAIFSDALRTRNSKQFLIV